MKRIVLILILACAVCAVVSAQTMNIYVSARGDDENDGSESAPIKTLKEAVLMAVLLDIFDMDARIIVVGTLNVTSEGIEPGDDHLFHFMDTGDRQILITGKPGATGSERAVLSGRDSGAMTVYASNTNIRFENIEISGGEGDVIGLGIGIDTGANVTLGPGAVVRGNSGGGIYVGDAACIINGGEVRDNSNTGIIVGEKGVLTMRSGTIRDNRTSGNAGGVYVSSGGRFTMSGGTITGNRTSMAGGGVLVRSGGRFDQTGGTISSNTASQGSNPNIFREQGALGSNLTSGSGSTASSGSSGSSSGSSSSSSSGFDWDIPIYFGIYLQGLNLNTASLGFPLQLGVEFDFGSAVSLALLGEIAGGVGAPYLIEFNYGGMAEIYFMNKTIGLGFGIGAHNALLPWLTPLLPGSNGSSSSMSEEMLIGANYIRLAVIFRKDNKLSLYGQYYNSGPSNGSWGLGLSWMFD